MPEPPLCRCHGEPMRWSNDKRKRRGGFWRCIVKTRGAQARYNQSEKGHARMKVYDATEKGRARDRRFRNSPMGSLNYQLYEMARVRVRY